MELPAKPEWVFDFLFFSGFLGFLLCLNAAIAVAKQAQKPLFMVAAASLKDALEEGVAL